MNWELALVFGLGLLVGSFVNVLTHRLPRMVMAEPNSEGAAARYDLCWPASHCPHCHTPLKAWHNIPVLSYVCLKGQCAFCQRPIGRRYPLTELATGLLWLACAGYWGVNPTGWCWTFFFTVLLALSIIDWQTTLLPDGLTQPLLWTGLVASALGDLPLDARLSIFGAVAGYGSLWLIATVFARVTGKQGMGAGDFKLLAGLGAWLGPLALIPLVMVASLLGTVVGLCLKFKGQLYDGAYVPFGPCLAIAASLIAVIGMERISVWMGW